MGGHLPSEKKKTKIKPMPKKPKNPKSVPKKEPTGAPKNKKATKIR
tara:strand:- start:6173 stop:6310 length:138 start_codon:yes stop_codon:yes gene_type:complete